MMSPTVSLLLGSHWLTTELSAVTATTVSRSFVESCHAALAVTVMVYSTASSGGLELCP